MVTKFSILTFAAIIAAFVSCAPKNGSGQSGQTPKKPAADAARDPSGRADAADISAAGEDGTDGEAEGQEGGDAEGEGNVGCRTFSDEFSTKTTIAGPVKAPLIGSIQLEVKADAEVAVEAGEKSAKLKIDGTITSVTPGLARSTADKALAAYRDPMVLTLVPFSKQAGLKGWEKLDCVVLGITALKNSKFDYTFDPALPFLVPAKPEGTSGASRTISGIKATVKRHFEEGNGAQKGTFSGSAKISAKGDAVSIDFDFGAGVPNIFATPVAGLKFVPDGKGGFSEITAQVWVSADNKMPVALKKN